MSPDSLIRILIEKLKISEEDAIVAATFATGGFTVDAIFFPTVGMPPFTVTIISGISGYVLSKTYKNNVWFRNRTLKKIDKWVESGAITKERGKELKDKLITKWLNGSHGFDE